MNQSQATAQARKYFGHAGFARDNGPAYAMCDADRITAKVELSELSTRRDSLSKVRCEMLRTNLKKQRYTVGVVKTIGEFVVMDVRGGGSSWDAAFEAVGAPSTTSTGRRL